MGAADGDEDEGGPADDNLEQRKLEYMLRKNKGQRPPMGDTQQNERRRAWDKAACKGVAREKMKRKADDGDTESQQKCGAEKARRKHAHANAAQKQAQQQAEDAAGVLHGINAAAH